MNRKLFIIIFILLKLKFILSSSALIENENKAEEGVGVGEKNVICSSDFLDSASEMEHEIFFNPSDGDIVDLDHDQNYVTSPLLTLICGNDNLNLNINDSRISDHTNLSSESASYEETKSLKEQVDLLLKNGADPNASLSDKSSVLMLAIKYGHVECVDVLLVHGADLNGINSKGETPLLLACEIGNLDLIAKLLGAGADPFKSESSRTKFPLQIDASYKSVPIDYDFIKEMVLNYDLESQYKLLEFVPELDRLELAYELGFFDIIRSLYRPNCVIQRRKYLKLLINNDIALLGNIYQVILASTLDGLVSFFKVELYTSKSLKDSSFCSDSSWTSYFMDSIYTQTFSFINLNAQYSYSYLEAACCGGNLEIVQKLAENKVDIDITQISLMFALKFGHLEIFDFLSSKFTITSSHEGIFNAAVMGGNIRIIDNLISNYGFKYDETTLLMSIKHCGSLEIVQKCLKESNALGTGSSALEVSAEFGRTEIFMYLFSYLEKEKKKNPAATSLIDISNTATITKLSGIAAINGHLEIVEYLKEKFKIRPSIADLKKTKNVDILKMFPEIFDSLSDLNLNAIAGSGDLDLVKRVFKRKYVIFGDCNFTPATILAAFTNGHLEIVNYLLERGVKFDVKRFILSGAALSLPYKTIVDFVTKHLGTNFCINDSRLECIKTGHLDILNFLLSLTFTNTRCNDQILTAILQIGNIEIIKILVGLGYKKELSKYSYVLARYGYLEILIYFHENNIVLSNKCVSEALNNKYSSLRIIKYLHKIGLVSLTSIDFHAVFQYKFTNVMEFLKSAFNFVDPEYDYSRPSITSYLNECESKNRMTEQKWIAELIAGKCIDFTAEDATDWGVSRRADFVCSLIPVANERMHISEILSDFLLDLFVKNLTINGNDNGIEDLLRIAESMITNLIQTDIFEIFFASIIPYLSSECFEKLFSALNLTMGSLYVPERMILKPKSVMPTKPVTTGTKPKSSAQEQKKYDIDYNAWKKDVEETKDYQRKYNKARKLALIQKYRSFEYLKLLLNSQTDEIITSTCLDTDLRRLTMSMNQTYFDCVYFCKVFYRCMTLPDPLIPPQVELENLFSMLSTTTIDADIFENRYLNALAIIIKITRFNSVSGISEETFHSRHVLLKYLITKTKVGLSVDILSIAICLKLVNLFEAIIIYQILPVLDDSKHFDYFMYLISNDENIIYRIIYIAYYPFHNFESVKAKLVEQLKKTMNQAEVDIYMEIFSMIKDIPLLPITGRTFIRYLDSGSNYPQQQHQETTEGEFERSFPFVASFEYDWSSTLNLENTFASTIPSTLRYPFSLLASRVLLARQFGISFSASEFSNQNTEDFAWPECVSFANFFIEREAQLLLKSQEEIKKSSGGTLILVR